MNNVHEDAPVVFETRWAMSYLRGPADADPDQAADGGPAAVVAREPAGSRPGRLHLGSGATSGPASGRDAGGAAPAPAPAAPGGSVRPVLPPGVPQHFVPVRGRAPAGAALVYQPMVLGAATIRFADAKAGVEQTEEVVVATPITDAAVPVSWDAAQPIDVAVADLETSPADAAEWAALPSAAAQAQELRGLEPRPRRVALRAAPARAPARSRVPDGLPAGRDRARLPRAPPRGLPGGA